jgi:YVTN family beta-propeller protein
MKKLVLALTLASQLALASTHAQNAYITNPGSDTVSVIDTATNTVSATVPVGLVPLGVAVSPKDFRQSSVWPSNPMAARFGPQGGHERQSLCCLRTQASRRNCSTMFRRMHASGVSPRHRCGRPELEASDLGAKNVTLQSSLTALRFYHAAGYRSVGAPVNGFGITSR